MTAQQEGVVHPTLKEFFIKYKLDQNGKLAVAVSGGPDSMALAHAVLQYFEGQIYLLCVNHGLRDSVAEEIAKIQNWVSASKNQKLSFHVLDWQGEKPDSSIMEAARFARYDLLNTFCKNENITSLFVGHHQDDQAETFLMRLISGSGVDGLAAMQEAQEYEDVTIYRPFMDLVKQDLIAYCNHNNIPFSHDPSNQNDDYLRPPLRQSMGVLETEGLTSKRLAGTAKRIGRARKALEFITLQAVDETLGEKATNKILVDFMKLHQYPEEIGLRVIKTHIEFFRPDEAYHVRMEKLEDLFHSLWFNPAHFKPRTLGGCKIYLNKNKDVLSIEKE